MIYSSAFSVMPAKAGIQNTFVIASHSVILSEAKNLCHCEESPTKQSYKNII